MTVIYTQSHEQKVWDATFDDGSQRSSVCKLELNYSYSNIVRVHANYVYEVFKHANEIMKPKISTHISY